MSKTMSEKLKEILASKTKEQFDQEWNAIVSLGLNGPTAKEMLDYFAEFQSEYHVTNDDVSVSDYDYSVAA